MDKFLQEKIVKTAKNGAAASAGRQLELLREFAGIDCGTGNEAGNAKVVEIVRRELEKIPGVQIELVEAPGFGHHVVARVRPEKPNGKILLNAHLDTVFQPGDAEKHPFRVEEDRAYGLGIADCKGGVVTSLFAVKIMGEAGMLPDKEIVMIYNCDEEIGSPTGQKIFERESKGAEAAFCFEPSRKEGGLITYRRGSLKSHVEITGKTAHASLEFEEGRSAVVELAAKILEINGFNDYENKIFYNAANLKGGIGGVGSVPDFASADVGLKPGNNEQIRIMTEKMAQLEKKPFIDGCVTKVDTTLTFPVLERTEANVALYGKISEIGRKMGLELPEQQTPASADGCFFSYYGVPTLDGFGPYMYEIHTTNESLRISSIEERTALFATVLGSL